MNKIQLKLMTIMLILFVFACIGCKHEVEETAPVNDSPKTYSVKFFSKYGGLTNGFSEEIRVDANSILTEEQLFELSYDFANFNGWYDGEIKAVAGEYVVTKDVVLIASWTYMGYSVISYESEYGDIPNEFRLKKGDPLTEDRLPILETTYYTFDGWFLKESDVQVKVGDIIMDDSVLYAKWSPKICTIRYECNGGTLPDNAKTTFTSGKWVTLVEAEHPYKAFDGWYDTEDFSTPRIEILKRTSDVVLYARWADAIICDPSENNPKSIYTKIKNMTESGTITVTGHFLYPSGRNELERIGDALIELWEKDSEILVTLDLSLVRNFDGVGSNGFEDCKNLYGIILPNSIKFIYRQAFSGCTNLTNIEIPHRVERIEVEAFKNCINLKTMIIPDSVTDMESGIFAGCTGLTNIKIPENITELGRGTFKGCTGLKSINLPNTITKIGSQIFEGCTSLKELTISEGVTKIENNTFAGCSELASISIPTGITEIGADAFNGCSKLTSIHIPSNVAFIGEHAFKDCNALVRATFSDTTSKWYISYPGNPVDGKLIGVMSSTDTASNASQLRTGNAKYNEKYGN